MGRGLAATGVLLLVALLAAPVLFAAHSRPAWTPAPASPATAPNHPAASPGQELRPRLGGGSAELLVYANDTAIAPATGVEANLTAFTPAALPPASSFQVSVAAVLGGVEVVFGIFQNTGNAPTAFLASFSNRTDQYLSLSYWRNLTLVDGTPYGFNLEHGSGTNWTLTIGGALFDGSRSNATIDCGVSSLQWVHGLSFSETVAFGGNRFVPPAVVASLAFATEQGSGWYLPRLGVANQSGFGSGPWGIQGRVQHPTLAPGELVSGPSIAPVANGTPLWRSGPVPVDLRLQVSPTGPLAFGTVSVNASLTDPNGTPLPSVPLQFSDSNGSMFFPAGEQTDANGTALAAFPAPNASAPATDTVSAVVELLGFLGNAQSSITTSPAQELLVSPVNAPGRIVPGATVQLTFEVRTVDSHPASGVAVLFTLSGPGAVDPTAAATASDGTVAFTISSYGELAVLQVTVRVQQPGFWGHDQVGVRVAPDPPTLLDTIAPYEWPAVGIAVAAVLVFAFYTRRRPRGALPVLRLPPPRRRVRVEPPRQP
ncbi:MAG: hypothetical protein L3K04_03650 [Thermoplasmata archaeon]|nr:hypothetical protein [Thermoplasmata archaeon]